MTLQAITDHFHKFLIEINVKSCYFPAKKSFVILKAVIKPPFRSPKVVSAKT